jgi:hypothetical protein
MSYIGNTNTTQAFTPAIDYFSGNGSTTAFTLSRPIASVAQVQVVVNNVAQNPSSAYTVSGNTITFTSAPSSGTNNIYVYYTSPITQVIAPGQGTVGLTQLSATGTPNSSKFLRGDNVWSSLISTNLPTGTVLQVQRNQVTGRTTGANTFTYTTSALSSPSSTTGSKYLEVASFTPISATSLILIQVYCSVLTEQTNTSNQAGAAIWKNNTGAPLTVFFAINLTPVAGAIGVINSGTPVNMSYIETAGSTTARTYSWYAGVDGGPSVINGFGADNSFGGQMSSIMTVTEILA